MKLKLFCTAMLTALLATATVYAQDIRVNVNGTPIDFTGAQPSIVDGRTLVPLRGVFEKLGFSVEWDANTKTATLDNGSTIVTAKVGELVVENETGDALKVSDVQPQIINDYFMVPVRAISEASGSQVDWDAASKTVSITTTATTNTAKEEKNDLGTLTATAEEYINATYSKIKEIREEVKANNDQVLLRFLSMGYIWDKSITATVDDYSKITQLLDELKAITPSEDLVACQPYIDAYCDYMNQAIELAVSAKAGAITGEQLLTELDTLKEEKEEMAINFSVVLYEVLEANTVYFEGAFDEYVLDMLK